MRVLVCVGCILARSAQSMVVKEFLAVCVCEHGYGLCSTGADVGLNKIELWLMKNGRMIEKQSGMIKTIWS